jgi:hypothetical protein
MIILSKVQTLFFIESRSYDSAVVEYIALERFKHYRECAALSKISQNSLVVIREDFFEQLTRRLFQDPDDAYYWSDLLRIALKSIVDSQKPLLFTEHSSCLSEFTFALSVVKNPVLFYETGRLCGYNNCNIMQFSALPWHQSVSLILGYLLQVKKRNSICEELVLETLKTAITDDILHLWPDERNCRCAILFWLIRLKLKGSEGIILELLDGLCCFHESRDRSNLRDILKSIVLEQDLRDKGTEVVIDKLYYSDSHTEEALMLLIADKWHELSDAAKAAMIRKLNTLHSQELLLKIDLIGHSDESLLKAVESIAFRAQAAAMFEYTQGLELKENVRLKIAAHWVFVDEFWELSKYWSIHCLIELAVKPVTV